MLMVTWNFMKEIMDSIPGMIAGWHVRLVGISGTWETIA